MDELTALEANEYEYAVSYSFGVNRFIREFDQDLDNEGILCYLRLRLIRQYASSYSDGMNRFIREFEEDLDNDGILRYPKISHWIFRWGE